METVSYSELRQRLKAHMDRVCADHAPLLVTRQGGEPVVMLSLAGIREPGRNAASCSAIRQTPSTCANRWRRLKRESRRIRPR